MGLLTKIQTRVAVAEAIDDAAYARWSAANLDLLITLVQDSLWQQILDTAPYFLSVLENETTSASGVIDITTGLTSKRFYRVQDVLKNADSTVYTPVMYGEATPTSQYYYILGDEIVTSDNSTSTDVVYAYLPTKFDDLASDATVLDEWPLGHEAALIYMSAAWALTKGDAESMAQVGRIADTAVDAMLRHVARRYPVPVAPRQPAVISQTVRNPLIPLSVGGG